MDQQQKEKVVQEAREKQTELQDTIRAVKGEAYLDQIATLASIILLGRAIATLGYVEVSNQLCQSALANAFSAFGVKGEELSMGMAKDAIALADVSTVR
ncbi:hypothetical protein J7E62_24675 [Variovorax paradoxus]|nr:hypothetical protein [Variovorax paradoxus]